MDPSLKIDVTSLAPADRHAMEHMLGLPLQPNQQLIIQVATLDPSESRSEATNVMDLVEHFYDGMNYDEVEQIDALIKTRANLTRPLP